MSLLLIALIVRKVDWRQLRAVLEHLDPRWAAAASGLTFVLIGTLALRWRIFLQQQDFRFQFSTIFGLTWAGQFFNSVLPGSTGGDVIKIYQLCRRQPDRKAAAAASVFADRFSALIALAVLAGVALVIEPAPVRILQAQGLTWRAITALAGAGSLLAITTAWLGFRLIRSTKLFGRICRTLYAAKRALTLGADSVAAICLSFGLHLLNFFIVYLFARALGVSISYGQVLLIMPVVLFCMLVPVTINGHGVREVLLIGYFSVMGIGLAGPHAVGVQEIVVALSVVAVANDLLWSLPGGLWYFVAGRHKTHAAVPQVNDQGADTLSD